LPQHLLFRKLLLRKLVVPMLHLVVVPLMVIPFVRVIIRVLRRRPPRSGVLRRLQLLL